MSASVRNVQTIPAIAPVAAGLIALAVAVALAFVVAFGQLTTVAGPSSAAVVPATQWDHGASSDAGNVPLIINGSGGSNRLRMAQ